MIDFDIKNTVSSCVKYFFLNMEKSTNRDKMLFSLVRRTVERNFL